MSRIYPKPDSAAAAHITAFLRENPSWLAENPELYRVLTPPRRVYGDQMADHMAAMLDAERAGAAAVLAAGRAAAGLAARVQGAVLALIRSRDATDCIEHELPPILGLDAVTLCAEPTLRGARPLPPGSVAQALGGREVRFRDAPHDAPLFHAEAARLARCDVLIRVPLLGPPALLALAAREQCLLEPGNGAAALAFLGRSAAAALDRAA